MTDDEYRRLTEEIRDLDAWRERLVSAPSHDPPTLVNVHRRLAKLHERMGRLQARSVAATSSAESPETG